MLSLVQKFCVNPRFADSSRKLLLVCLALSAVSVLALFSPDLRANWWIVDDHEMIGYLGTRSHVPLAEAPAILIHRTEAGEPGINLRYRPVYYGIKILETVVFGKHPTLWYAFDIVVAIITFGTLFYLLSFYFGFYPSLLIWTTLIWQPFWSDMYTRLGPGEITGGLGLAGLALCLHRIRKLHPQSPANKALWWLAFLCVFLAVGAKENFIFAFIPLLTFLFLEYRSSRSHWHAFASGLLSTVWSFFVAGAIILAVTRAGRDFYASSVSLVDRFALISKFFISLNSHLLVTHGLVLGCFFLFFKKRDRPAAFFAVCGFVVILLQYLFYSGQWPTGTRYDVPGLIVPFILLAFLFSRALRHSHMGLTCLCAACFLVFVSQSHPVGIFRVGVENARRTNAFVALVEHAKELAQTFPDQPIIFLSHNIWDYEHVISMRRYLRAWGVNNPIALEITTYSRTSFPVASLPYNLARLLSDMSEKGDTDFISLPTTRGQKCFSLGFEGPSKTGCQTLGIFTK